MFETMDDFSMELELMQSTDLHETIASLDSDEYLSERHVKQIISQLVDAVSLCNRLGIAHRDIKLSNITIPRNVDRYKEAYRRIKSRNNNGGGTDGLLGEEDEDDSFFPVKLADFGMAGFVCSDRKLKGRCGTPGYVAPDILRAGKKDSYPLNVDMFSVSSLYSSSLLLLSLLFIQ